MVSKKLGEVDEALHTLKKFQNIRENLEKLRSQMKAAGDVGSQIREVQESIVEVKEFQEKIKQVANTIEEPQDKLAEIRVTVQHQAPLVVEPVAKQGTMPEVAELSNELNTILVTICIRLLKYTV